MRKEPACPWSAWGLADSTMSLHTACNPPAKHRNKILHSMQHYSTYAVCSLPTEETYQQPNKRTQDIYIP
jgi:hypothetical protein